MLMVATIPCLFIIIFTPQVALILLFQPTIRVACNVPFTVNFTNTTINSQLCTWSFGDGNTSTANNPSHTYTAAGAYSVTLTVVDSLGCSNWLTKTNYININVPVAGISADVKKGCIPLTVNFSDSSTISPPGNFVALGFWRRTDWCRSESDTYLFRYRTL